MTDAATDTSTATGSGGATAANGVPGPAAVERPGSLPTKAESTAAAKLQAERLVTHLFECNLAGYDGWRWAVTMARPPRSRTATVCELELLPGEGALLAPPWVPWADRLRAGDLGRSDHLPRRETDERLEPGWEATGEEGDAVALDELDLGRARVLSSEGIQRAAQRWYDGEHGPDADGVGKAHATCSSCGFLLPIAGQMRHVFGVCANELAVDDGRVVSLDHGCGAHSETDLPDQGSEWPVTPSYMDDRAMEPLGADGERPSGAEGEPAAEKAERRPARTGRGSGRKRARRPRTTAGALAPDAGEGAPDADEEPKGPRRPKKPEKSEKSVENPVAPQEEPAPTSRSRRPARARRAATSQEEASETARRSPAADEPAERAAAARDAVASLTAGMQERDAAPEAAGPTTLAELEARLPGRDRS